MRTKHDGDCSYYSSLCNRRPEDGVCTCGYGLDHRRTNQGDNSQMYSDELKGLLESKLRPCDLKASELLDKLFGVENAP